MGNMGPLFLKHKKSGIVHIAYDLTQEKGLYNLYCGREIGINNSWRRYAYDCSRETFCRACVARHKRKFGHDPSWDE